MAHLPFDVQKNVSIPKDEDGYVSCEYYDFNYTEFSDTDFIYNWDRYI